MREAFLKMGRIAWLVSLGIAGYLMTTHVALAQTPPREPPESVNVTLPTVVEHVDPIYPPERLAQALDRKVELIVTVELDGTVGDTVVLTSGGAEFDHAAMEAVSRWRFIPATRAGTPIRARIHIPFHFSVHAHALSEPDHALLEPVLRALKRKPKGAPLPKPKVLEQLEVPVDLGTPLALPHAVNQKGKPLESHVQGRIQPANRSESDVRLERDLLQAAPRFTAADLVRSAPGMLVTRPYGDAIAPRMSLRGFDADHGRDIQLTILGTIPLNQPSHIHGQGYADIDMLIPETVRVVRVLEGAYDPNQGEFAVAGSIDFDLGVEDRGIRSTYSYGSFDTLVALGVLAPVGHPEETFGAANVRTTAGFGDGTRGSTSGAFIGQYRLELPGNTTAILHVSGHGARAGVGGVLRREDVHSGDVDFLHSYDDPSAQAQIASTARVQGGFSLQRAGRDDGTNTSIGLWGAYATYRSRINTTGYTERSQTQPELGSRGDLIEQANEDLGFGARLALRTRRFRLLSWLDAQFTRGADIELHLIDQAQNLIEVPNNATWDQRVDASIRTFRAGLFLDGVVSVTKKARLHGGLRTDVVLFQVHDRLSNGAPANASAISSTGLRRTTAGVAWGPRLTLEWDPRPDLRLSAAYGQGYRSPQALQVAEGDTIPFAKVHSYEVGARYKVAAKRLTAALIAYETRLSDDWAFDATPGRYVRIGSTVRRGFVTYIQAEPVTGLKTSFSATYVRATLDGPTQSNGNSTPAYVQGQALPFVPPVLVRVDVKYERPIIKLGTKPLIGRIGYGATFASPRPLPHGLYAQPVFTLDATASLRRDPVEVGIDAVNLFDRRYADTEYVFVSNWGPSNLPSQLPAKHLSAGPPLTVMGTATFRF